MKNRVLQTAALALILGFGASLANAAAVLVDPDDFAAGTDISNAFLGVTFTTVFANNPTVTPTSTGAVYAVADNNASRGSLAFGQSPTDSSWGNGVFEYLRIDFASEVNWVSLDFFANDFSDSNPELLAFDLSGNLVDSMSIIGTITQDFPAHLTVTGDIHYVFAYWDEINRIETGGLDKLKYIASVPEPGSLVLLSLGLAGLGFSRRKKNV